MNYWMWQTWPDDVGDDYHNVKINQKYSIVAQSKRTKGEENFLNKGDIIFFYETKTKPTSIDWEVFFSWDDVDIPGINNYEFYVFLDKYFNINFTKKPDIRKINEKNVIILSDGGKTITIKLNLLARPPLKKEVQTSLTINGVKTINCWATNEDNKITLYKIEPLPKRVSNKGRGGIFAVACAQSRFTKHQYIPEKFYEIPPKDFDLEWETEITHTGGFVPREELCTIMGYEPNYLFFGWGLRRIIKPDIVQKISKYYNSHKAPW
jgi:hypothetical protein